MYEEYIDCIIIQIIENSNDIDIEFSDIVNDMFWELI